MNRPLADASEGVVTLLIGGDEKNLAAHPYIPGRTGYSHGANTSNGNRIAGAGTLRAMEQPC
jgi:hypothetical protein